MKTVQQVLQLTQDFLQKQGIAQHRREAEDLLAGVLSLKRMDLYLNFERPLNDAELQLARERLGRRASGEPLAYIEGVVEFAACEIEVSPDVLIPRPETELLWERVSQWIESRPQVDTLWDVCTGSGCLAIAFKKRFPRVNVVASDLSESALALARRNGERNGVEVDWRHGDLLAPYAGERCDLLISNPPYISSSDYVQLDREVRDFEPRIALEAGEEGLICYQRIADAVSSNVNPGGLVALEMGYQQGKSVQSIFRNKSFDRGRVDCDWAGHERFFFLEVE